MEQVTLTCTVADGSQLPQYATKGSAGADICAFLTEPVTLEPNGGRALIPTGIAMEIPAGYEVQIRPRSGLAFSYGVTVLNAPGTIDSDYRGEIKIMLINLGQQEYVITDGMRIAQCIVAPVISANFTQVSFLSDSDRGAKGFGSTGV